MSDYSLNPRVLGELHTGLGEALDGVQPVSLNAFAAVSNTLDEVASGMSYSNNTLG